jgi:hypothetical protein
VTVVSMSGQEFSRLKVLLDVQSGRLRVDDAAQLAGIGRRQAFRLLKVLRDCGPAGDISILRRQWCVGARLKCPHLAG